MNDVQIIWDLPDDPDGNYVHIIDGHDVTVDEVEEVLRDPDANDAISRSSGMPAVFGWTSTGKYIIVVYELVIDDPYTVYPITAYPVTPPLKGCDDEQRSHPPRHEVERRGSGAPQSHSREVSEGKADTAATH